MIEVLRDPIYIYIYMYTYETTTRIPTVLVYEVMKAFHHQQYGS